MDAGIRAPGAKNIYLPVSKARQSLFQKILNTNPFVLFLPAEEVSAVVFYRNFVTHNFLVCIRLCCFGNHCSSR